MTVNEQDIYSILTTLADISIALSQEKDSQQLLETILFHAMRITRADAGTLYTATEDGKELHFEILINKSMKMHLGGTSPNNPLFENLKLYDAKGKPNINMLAPWVALNNKSITIKNAYTNKQFDLSGTKAFDKKTGYRSKSFLTVPMVNHLHEVIGVLQLINPIERKTKTIRSFSKFDELIVGALASQAAITITNKQLIQGQKDLFDALIQLIAQAIDDKSPFTGAHCRRVPVITKMLAQAACAIQTGPLKDFTMTEDELYELEVAAWLHDCGKIAIPEAIVDKATKLESIIDGMELIDLRYEILKRETIINRLQKEFAKVTGQNYPIDQDSSINKRLKALDKERALLSDCNIGREHFSPELKETIDTIAKRQWINKEGESNPILSTYETQMLKIEHGTLSQEERNIINNHVSITLKMLQSLPYPKNLQHVPDLAGSHHEKLDGSGYPRGLTKDQLSLPARMIAIADIFEALTASDRPYKKAMPISQALSILGTMKLQGYIDPDLFDVFMHTKIYEQYAEQYLNKGAINLIDLSLIPGYRTLE